VRFLCVVAQAATAWLHPSLSYPVCLRAGMNARADAGFAMLAGLEIVALACAALSIALSLSGVV
jgi:hypothetical protein